MNNTVKDNMNAHLLFLQRASMFTFGSFRFAILLDTALWLDSNRVQ